MSTHFINAKVLYKLFLSYAKLSLESQSIQTMYLMEKKKILTMWLTSQRVFIKSFPNKQTHTYSLKKVLTCIPKPSISYLSVNITLG